MFSNSLKPYSDFIEENLNSSVHSNENEDILITEIISKPIENTQEESEEEESEEEEEEEEESEEEESEEEEEEESEEEESEEEEEEEESEEEEEELEEGENDDSDTESNISEGELYKYIASIQMPKPIDANIEPVIVIEKISPNLEKIKIPYYFLNDNTDFLLSEFTEETFIENKKNMIQLCIYNIDDSCYHLPFLKYLLINNSDLYSFPNFDYEYTMENENDKCKNECLKQVYEIFNYKPTAFMNVENISKDIEFMGHIKQNDDIYVIIKINKNVIPTKFSNDNYTWSILHEIVNSQKIKNVPINSLLQKFFLEYPALLYIKNKQNIPIDIPYLLYSIVSEKVSMNNESLEQEQKEQKEQEQKEQEQKEQKEQEQQLKEQQLKEQKEQEQQLKEQQLTER